MSLFTIPICTLSLEEKNFGRSRTHQVLGILSLYVVDHVLVHVFSGCRCFELYQFERSSRSLFKMCHQDSNLAFGKDLQSWDELLGTRFPSEGKLKLASEECLKSNRNECWNLRNNREERTFPL